MPEVTVRIADGADDAHEQRNGSNFSASLQIVAVQAAVTETSRFDGGLIFPALGIPHRAQIDSATLQVVALTHANMAAEVSGEKNFPPADYATEADVVDRSPLTGVSTSWSEDGLTLGQYNDSPDLRYVLQEMVSHPDYDPESPVSLILRGAAGVDKTVWIAAIENPGGDWEAQLVVEWSTPDDAEIALEQVFPAHNLEAGDLLCLGDPDLYKHPETGGWRMLAAGARANVDGVDLFEAALPVESDLDAPVAEWIAGLSGTPIVARPASGWDSWGIETPCYVEGYDATAEEDVRRIYYTGASDGTAAAGGSPLAIGVLQWNKGESKWERHGDAVIEGTEEWELNGEHGWVLEPSVYYDAATGTWHAWWSAGSDLVIVHATSTDGVTWTGKAIVFSPIGEIPSLAWSPCVKKVGGHYEMVTAAIAKPGKLSRAWSRTPSGDEADWQGWADLLPNNPPPQLWAENWVYGATLAVGDDGHLYGYYTGRDDVNGASFPHIGRFVVEPMVTGTVGLGAARMAYAVGG